MPTIDYYFSTISPWCYFLGDRLEQLAQRHNAKIVYRPLDLYQLFDRTGGVRSENRHPNRIEYRSQELPRWAEHLGMEFNFKPSGSSTNSAPSSYAIIAAQRSGGDVGKLVQSVLRAHWAEERDISDDATLRDLLEKSGFDGGLVNSGLLVGAEEYARNLDEAVAAGVFGVPFMIVRETDQRFWGQDRLDFLDRHLASL